MAKDVGKSNQRASDQKAAARLAHLRDEKFVTQGFGSNERIPSLTEARKMHSFNLRAINTQKPTPSVSS